VANARKVRAIYDNDKKCDRIDAEQLARFARVDPKLLSPIAHRDRATRADLGMLRSRSALVTARTKLVNHVRGCLKSFGVRLAMCSTATFPRRAAWQIPRDLRRCLVPVLRAIAGLTQQILAFERRIEQVAGSRYPETQRLRQVDGVGAMTSLTFVLTLEDPRRFRTSRRVGAYLGLRPGRRQSGKGDPELHITKAGDCELRRLLVQSAMAVGSVTLGSLAGTPRSCAATRAAAAAAQPGDDRAGPGARGILCIAWESKIPASSLRARAVGSAAIGGRACPHLSNS